jgi:hypothetical protein
MRFKMASALLTESAIALLLLLLLLLPFLDMGLNTGIVTGFIR